MPRKRKSNQITSSTDENLIPDENLRTAKQCINYINTTLANNNIHITQPIEINKHTIEFIMNENHTKIGNITLTVSNDDVLYPTRSGVTKTVNVIHVNWIEIGQGYQGNGYATMLLLYALCTIYVMNPTLQQIHLEDATDPRPKITGQPLTTIYAKLGFTHNGIVSLNASQPNSTLRVNADGAKSTTFDHLFTVIQNKQRKQRKGSMHRTNRKGGTRRKRRTRR